MTAAPSVISAPAAPSALRGWWALVVLSWRRQARARQMVWIALALLAFAVVFTAVQTARVGWGMHRARHPRRTGPTYPTWAHQAQTVLGVVHRSPGAHAVQHAVFGATHLVLDPAAKDDQGRTVALSGFHRFSLWVVLLLFLSFLLPLWSLSFATEAIGGEREGQSLIWVLARPLPRWSIYLARFVALLPWTVGFNVGGFALLCLAAGPPGWRALALYWPAVLAATLTFSALFLLMGAWFRWPAVVAIVYSFCLEVVLGNMPGYLKRVSVGFYARCLMFERAAGYGVQPENPDVFLPVSGATALLVLLGGAVALLALGMWVFTRTEYHEVG